MTTKANYDKEMLNILPKLIKIKLNVKHENLFLHATKVKKFIIHEMR